MTISSINRTGNTPVHETKMGDHAESLPLRSRDNEPTDTETIHQSRATDSDSHGQVLHRFDTDNKERTSFFRRHLSTPWTHKSAHAGLLSPPSGTNSSPVCPPLPGKGPLGLRLLAASPDPLVELIFVHGLGGGSVKTWQKGGDPSLFWPKAWLPTEAELRHVSVHSFGYDADWKSSRPSILNVQDFGTALYEDIRSSTWLREHATNPIILLGHSMGGLVIKKAYICARKDESQPKLADRVQCIIFLATPHRGSDYAATLNKILKVSGFTGRTNSREYINDLAVGSASTKAVNDEFARFACDVPIYSFYETLEMSFRGLVSSIIVERSSAVLGTPFTKERVRYLDASHIICKFPSPDDSNYLTLKNALATAVHDLLSNGIEMNQEASKAELLSIRSHLSLPPLVEEHYPAMEGSCEWIEDLPDFRTWRDPKSSFESDEKFNPYIYWVHANPGAGKTMLAAYVHSQLRDLKLQHAAYYFHFGKKATQSLAVSLRAIAYDMARSNDVVRERLGRFCNGSSILDQDDVRAIWSEVLKAAIFQAPLDVPQYWVIDALDECVRYTEFFSLLRGVQACFPLRIFLTSRRLNDSQKLLRQIDSCAISVVELPAKNTKSDIELFVRNRVRGLHIDAADEKEELTKVILKKSDTSFLWARLVLDELDDVYGHEGIRNVLRMIPPGMMPYYKRIIRDMEQNEREKHIAKAILRWSILAARPLSVTELTNALKLDIGANLSSPKQAVEVLCGQLLTIDLGSNEVHIVHATAREFLVSEDAGYFALRKGEDHDRISLSCLRLLNSPQMQPPRHKSLLQQKRLPRPHPPLLDYAISYFSEHIFNASTESDELVMALDKFFSLTVLAWIEKLAIAGGLHHLIRTARNLKGYLERAHKHRSHQSPQLKRIGDWATDISMLAARFADPLRLCPHSIYFLIPPLCPTESAIYKQFGRVPQGLGLLALNNRYWDDCIATLNFEDDTAATLGCGANLIAIGFETGTLHLYNHRNYQKTKSIPVKFPVELIRIDPEGQFLAASSRKCITVWDLHGNLRWEAKSRRRSILLTSSATVIISITEQGIMLKRNAQTGELIEEQTFVYQPPDFEVEDTSVHTKTPFHATISTDFQILALAYRNAPICMFDVNSQELVGWAIDSHSRAPAHIIFNPNPETNLLLVAYNESHLALYDSWSGAPIHENNPEEHVVYNCVTCSPDGRTFATVDVRGTLRIWDFGSLVELYHVVTPSHSFRILEFTSDALCLLDLVDQELRIWSPSTLVRRTEEEDAGISDYTRSLPVIKGQYEKLRSSRIDAFCVHEKLPFVFCGTHQGDVVAYYCQTGEQSGVLYSHREAVRCVTTCKAQLIASSDLNGTVQVWEFSVSSNSIKPERLVLEKHFSSTVHQLVFNEPGGCLLISTTDADFVYNTRDKGFAGSMRVEAGPRSLWKWIKFPDFQVEADGFALIENETLTVFSGLKFPSKAAGLDTIPLNYLMNEDCWKSSINSVSFIAETRQLIVEVQQTYGYSTKSAVFVFQFQTLQGLQKSSLVIKLLDVLPTTLCTHFLGMMIRNNKPRLVFLDHNSWVVSIDAAMLVTEKQYIRHFFVPGELIPGSYNMLPLQSAKDDFIFYAYNEIAIVKNGLQFSKMYPLDFYGT